MQNVIMTIISSFARGNKIFSRLVNCGTNTLPFGELDKEKKGDHYCIIVLRYNKKLNKIILGKT